MAGANEHRIDVRCACGKVHSFLSPIAGERIECDACGSLVEVTAADLETTFADDGSIQIHRDKVEPLEARLIEQAPMRVAPRGARPGIAEGIPVQTEDMLVAEAVGGRYYSTTADEAAKRGYIHSEIGRPARGFLRELALTFAFAGRKDNALNVLFTAAAGALPLVLLALLPVALMCLVLPLVLVVSSIVGLYVVQFLWRVMMSTANGEDDVPLIEPDWDFWEDAAKPMIWLLLITVLCSLPGLLAWWYVKLPAGQKEFVVLGALMAGWFFWPVAVISVALGNTILYMRPDWMVRCVIGIGPVYLVVWPLVMITLGMWGVFRFVPVVFMAIPYVGGALYWIVLTTVNLYFGYVTFRTLGLLFRHYRRRLPWKF